MHAVVYVYNVMGSNFCVFMFVHECVHFMYMYVWVYMGISGGGSNFCLVRLGLGLWYHVCEYFLRRI